MKNQKKFKLEWRYPIIQVEHYMVEAENEEEALRKFNEELAGKIEPMHMYTRSSTDLEDTVKVIKQ